MKQYTQGEQYHGLDAEDAADLLVLSDEDFRPDALAEALMNLEPPPCVDCALYDKCAAATPRIACADFARYVDPTLADKRGIGLVLKNLPARNPQPSLYKLVYSEKDE